MKQKILSHFQYDTILSVNYMTQYVVSCQCSTNLSHQYDTEIYVANTTHPPVHQNDTTPNVFNI